MPSGAFGGWSRAGGLSQLEELISLEKRVLTILPPQQILYSHPQPLLRKPGIRLSKPGSNAQSSLELEGGNPRVFTSSPPERPWASGLTSDLLVLIIVIDPVLELGSLTLWGPSRACQGPVGILTVPTVILTLFRTWTQHPNLLYFPQQVLAVTIQGACTGSFQNTPGCGSKF